MRILCLTSYLIAFVAAVTALAGSTAARAGSLDVTSPSLTAGEPVSADQYWDQFGCTGKNVRPALKWSNPPEGTKSFAVTFYDKDAPTGSGFWHWVVFNLPASTRELSSSALPDGAVEGNTDLGKPGYFGPCPPKGRKHVYTFSVHALDVDKLEAPEGATSALTGFYINLHTLAKGTLSVTAGPRK